MKLLKKVQVILYRVIKLFYREKVTESKNNNDNSFFTEEEASKLVQQMDKDNYDFDKKTWDRMLEQWIACPDKFLLPTKLKNALKNCNAKLWNTKEYLDLLYKLPFQQGYEIVNTIAYKNLIEKMIEHRIQLKDKIIVDVGCGIGTLIKLINEKYKLKEMIGIEIAPSAIKWIKNNRPFIKGFVNNIENPIGQKEYYVNKADVVICQETLEHVNHPDIALKNLLLIKNKNGVVVITVPNGMYDRPKEGKSHPQHINFWTPEEWEKFIKANSCGYKTSFTTCSSPNLVGGHMLLAIIK